MDPLNQIDQINQTAQTNQTNQVNQPDTSKSKYLVWFKAHEKLVLSVIAAIVLVYMFNGGLKTYEKNQERKSTEAEVQVRIDREVNFKEQKRLTELVDKLEKQNTELEKQISDRAVQTEKQKKLDRQMSPDEISARLQKLLEVKPEELKSTPISGELIFTPPAVEANLQALEDLGRLKQDNQDLTSIISSQVEVINKQTESITGLRKEIDDERASHEQDVKTYKAKSRTSWLKGFKIGFIVAAVGIEAVRIFTGHP